MSEKFSKWVSCWGNATSITERKEAVYAKDITLRYPIYMCFKGSKIRLHLSNYTGTEAVSVTECCVSLDKDFYDVKVNGSSSFIIDRGQEVISDEIEININKGQYLNVSMYFSSYTQMNAGTLVTGPLSKGYYSYGNHIRDEVLPNDYTRSTNIFYFLNTIDIYTENKNRAIICYGDSITAGAWPDYLQLRCNNLGLNNVSIIRRAVCGTRILRQYECITYQAYGIKGEIRFPIECNACGADTVIIQHGINDIIHPVGVEVNKWRPMSDMPTVEDLKKGIQEFYVKVARERGFKVYCGTLLPIYGWRTYNEDKEKVRVEFNDWLRESHIFDGCIDFDKTLRGDDIRTFASGFDSGDHLHPSNKAYEAMAASIPEEILR